MWTDAFHPPLRWCTVAWVLGGATLATMSAVLAFTRIGTRDGIAYAAIAAVLVAVAIAIARGRRWITALTLAVCAAQIGAAIGLILELWYGIAASKATHLRRLGFDPTVGVVINLVLSLTAFLIFLWFLTRWRRLRQHRR